MRIGMRTVSCFRFLCQQHSLTYSFFNNTATLFLLGLPGGIGKFIHLEILYLSHNELELIPEGISRCVKLRKLKLDNNKLITLPDGIHLLPDLKEMDLQQCVFILLYYLINISLQ